MVRKSTELFTEHYKNNYVEYPDLPIWMLTEIISFGALSQMYKRMLKKDQKTISERYHRQPNELTTWIHHLVYIRNLCTHHARLWDRTWAIKPRLPAAKYWYPPLLPGNDHLFSTILIVFAMLNKMPYLQKFTYQWKRNIEELLDNPPSAPDALKRMGFTSEWKQHASWNIE